MMLIIDISLKIHFYKITNDLNANVVAHICLLILLTTLSMIFHTLQWNSVNNPSISPKDGAPV